MRRFSSRGSDRATSSVPGTAPQQPDGGHDFSHSRSHDFYPVLFYFRFPEARYSASRTTLLLLDAVSLIRAAVPDGENGWIKRTASVDQLS